MSDISDQSNKRVRFSDDPEVLLLPVKQPNPKKVNLTSLEGATGFYVRCTEEISAHFQAPDPDRKLFHIFPIIRKHSESFYDLQTWSMNVTLSTSIKDLNQTKHVYDGKNRKLFSFGRRSTMSFLLKKCQPKLKIMDIYSASKRKPIGWVKVINVDGHEELVMTDFETELIFFLDLPAKQNENKTLQILNLDGTTLAVCKCSKRIASMNSLEYVEWRIEYVESLPTSVKIVTLSAFLLGMAII